MCVEHLEKLYNVISTVVTVINVDVLTLLYTCAHYLRSGDVIHVQHVCTMLDFLLKKLSMLKDYITNLPTESRPDIRNIVDSLSNTLQELRDKIVMSTLRADDRSIMCHVSELVNVLVRFLTKFSDLYLKLCYEYVFTVCKCLSL